MAIASKEFIIKAMSENIINAKKKLSQNFLINEEVVLKTVDELSQNNVVEIGPGIGSLTEEILKRNKVLYAYEIDKTLIPLLKKQFSFYPSFHLIEGDFLKQDFSYDFPISVVSNLPYSLTSPILEKILLSDNDIKEVVIMVQKEFYLRIKQTKGKDYGPLNILISLLGKLDNVMNVSRNNFLPVPNVDSSVIKITILNSLEFDKKDFYRFLNSLFLMRRKTLSNNLSSYLKSKEKAFRILEKVSLDPSSRCETLSKEDFVKLYKEIKDYNFSTKTI